MDLPMMTDTPILISNDAIRVELDPVTGAVLQITNRLQGIDLVRLPAQRVPWRLEIANEDGSSRWIESFREFHHGQDENGVILHWSTDEGLEVVAKVSAPDGHGGISFEIDAHAAPGMVIDKVEYPILTGIGELHDTADSILVHSQGTGFLFRNPYHLFELRDGGVAHAAGGAGDACVGEDTVEAAKLIDCSLHERTHVFFAACVDACGLHLATCGGDALGRLGETCLCPVGDQQGGSLAGKELRAGAADATRCASDDYAFST